jgi:dihydroorotase
MQGTHRLLLKGGKVICPFSGLKGDPLDILVARGRIEKLGRGLRSEGARVLDLSGLYVSPGWLDAHVHLREPGREDEETVASGRMAALAGGFTAVCCMPNTDPPVDCAAVAEDIAGKAAQGEGADVFCVGAATVGRKGLRLVDMGEMHASSARVRAFSDDGACIQSAAVMRRALEYVRLFDGVIVSHCEDESLSAGGQVREGPCSFRLGLRGYPAAAEEVMVARDLLLAELTGSRLHLAHLSSRRSVEMLREAKQRGVRVTAEVTPHHLFFTYEDVDGLDARFKVNPPLGSREDREALRRALAEGVIDAVASDHAPHALEEKEREFVNAAFGMIGLETAFSACCTALLGQGGMDVFTLVERMTRGPAAALGLEPPDYGEGVREGARADLVAFDPYAEREVKAENFLSRSRNCPFDGMRLKGRVELVVKKGRPFFPGGDRWPAGEKRGRR